MTLIKNVCFGVDDTSLDGYVKTQNGIISEVGHGDSGKAEIVVDGNGALLYPGLCDIHTHGAQKIDFTSCSVDDACSLAKWYASAGVTSVFPTTATDTEENILKAVSTVAQASKLVSDVRFDGVHIEGPFLSHAKKGAHNELLLREPDIELVKKILLAADGLKVRITLAPELNGAFEFIEQCRKLGVLVTLGHSAAGAETALCAMSLGANCVTHTFNAMNLLHHREPGLLGAALSEDVYAELICDGLHVHPEAVKLFSRAKASDKAVLISDSIILAGCSENDGVFKSAGEDVHIKDGKIVTVGSETLAGSSLKLCDGVVNYMEFTGVSLDKAVFAASTNAAKAAGIYDLCGSIEKGKRADFVLMDRSGKLINTICGGKIVF